MGRGTAFAVGDGIVRFGPDAVRVATGRPGRTVAFATVAGRRSPTGTGAGAGATCESERTNGATGATFSETDAVVTAPAFTWFVGNFWDVFQTLKHSPAARHPERASRTGAGRSAPKRRSVQVGRA